MAASPGMWITAISNLILCVCSLLCSSDCQVSQTWHPTLCRVIGLVHRAPAAGLFLLACSGAAGSLLSVLPPSLRWAVFETQQDLCWIGCLLGPVLVSLNFYGSVRIRSQETLFWAGLCWLQFSLIGFQMRGVSWSPAVCNCPPWAVL